MKIALVIEQLDPVRGGRETYTAQIAAALSERGHEVSVLCQTSTLAPAGADVAQMEIGHGGATRLWRMRKFVADVQRQITGGGYDIVHAMLPVAGANVYHPHSGTIPGSVAGSVRRHGSIFGISARLLKRFNRCRNESARLERQIVTDGRALCLCVSDLVAREFRTYYGLSDRARVVFNGVNVPDPAGGARVAVRRRLRSALGVSSGDPVFLTVATNFPLKGVAESISAFAKWCHRDSERAKARLVIVGRELSRRYRCMAALHKVGKQVVFKGPTKEMFQWYAAADAFVLLTWYDPCSLTVLEAARWGIPSLTTRFNGAVEAFKSGGCIVVDSPRDIRGIVSAFDELADPQRHEEHSHACRALGRQLSIDRHIEELLEAYGEAGRLK